MSMFLLLKVNFWHIYVTHLTLFPADPSVLSDNSTCDTSCQDSHLLTQSVPHNETLLSQKSDLNPYFKREKEGTRILHVFRCNEWVGNIWCYQLGVWIFSDGNLADLETLLARIGPVTKTQSRSLRDFKPALINSCFTDKYFDRLWAQMSFLIHFGCVGLTTKPKGKW